MTDFVLLPRLLILHRRISPRDRWPRQRLLAHQEAALGRLRRQAASHSPFYRRIHAGLADRPLRELPVVTKAALMDHFDEVVTDPAIHREAVERHVAALRGDERFLGRYRVVSTSGSTGRRGLFVFDDAAWLNVMATFVRAHDWTGMRAGITHRMRTAEVASTTPWHLSARVGALLAGSWMPTLRLDAAQPPADLVGPLDAWSPDLLIGYPSITGTLADEQRAGRLHIAPTAVMTSAEPLTGDTRRRIHAAWGVQPFNQYAATEAGNIAAECEHHRGMHLMEDLAIFEVVDGDHRPVPPGEVGDKVLVTVLFNTVQPLIRYELSDRLRLAAEPCPCGRPYAVIEAVEGRTEEVLRFPAPGGGTVAVNPHLFHRVLDGAAVRTWQVVQEVDGVEVLIVGGAEAVGDTVASALRAELAAQGIVVPPVRVRQVPDIPRGATGKLLLIKSNVRQEEHALPAPTQA